MIEKMKTVFTSPLRVPSKSISICMSVSLVVLLIVEKRLPPFKVIYSFQEVVSKAINSSNSSLLQILH